MPKTGVSVAAHNRQMRRDALREQLSNQKHVEHVIVLLDKLRDLDEELDNLEITRLSKVIDTKLKLINKYLPDDKEPSDLNLIAQVTTQTHEQWLESLNE
ncbi:MAG: hypothetical protein JKY22_12050 [Flavobacteriaceae bacterium]|nr:hypothetical protein [Flavobacteriaceae bacterium]PCJ26482.1 MAG: hypothetical protein COA94_05075 [Rickettsiales bacterium]